MSHTLTDKHTYIYTYTRTHTETDSYYCYKIGRYWKLKTNEHDVEDEVQQE